MTIPQSNGVGSCAECRSKPGHRCCRLDLQRQIDRRDPDDEIACSSPRNSPSASSELKLTVNHGDDAERLEVLLDVLSLANGGGGYLIVGIKDGGRGRAQRFQNPGDTRQIFGQFGPGD